MDQLEADLKACHFDTWVDRRQREDRQSWKKPLQDAIDRCNVILVVLSPASVTSSSIQMEYHYALRISKRVILLEYQTCSDIPIALQGLQRINFAINPERGLSNLLIALNHVEIELVSESKQTIDLEPQSPYHAVAVTSRPESLSTEQELDDIYRIGAAVLECGDLELTVALWQQIPVCDPHFHDDLLVAELDTLLRKLRSSHITYFRKHALLAQKARKWRQAAGFWQALLSRNPRKRKARQSLEQCLRAQGKKASATSEWEQAISIWETVLKLKPDDAQATRQLSLATDHQNYAQYYKDAQQFIAEHAPSPARTQLRLLWQYAPCYGDPEGLALKAGMTKGRRSPDLLDKEERLAKEQREREAQGRTQRASKQAEAWRQWRQEHPDLQPDLSGANLSDRDLRGLDLRGVNLTGANLSRTNLKGANLSRAILIQVDLSRANLDEALLNPSMPGYIGHQIRGFAQGSPLHDFLIGIALPHAVLFGWATALGEMAIGLGTYAGFLFRPAAFFGMLLNLTFFLSASWNVYPYFYGADIVFVFCWVTMMLSGPLNTGLPSVDDWLVDQLVPEGHTQQNFHPLLQVYILLVVAGTPQQSSYTAGISLLRTNPITGGSLQAHQHEPGATQITRKTRRSILQDWFVAGAATVASMTLLGIPLRIFGKDPHANGAGTMNSTISMTSTTSTSTTPIPVRPVSVGESIAPVSAVPKNSSVTFIIASSQDAGILVHLPNDMFVAYDAVCTHAGCTVDYNPDTHNLECPCHGSQFDPAKGAVVLTGPAATPLRALSIQIDSATGAITLH